MNPARSPSPLRAMLFFSTALLLLATVGSALQNMLGLSGVVLYELLIFLGLALFFARYIEWRPVRALFRLHPLSAGGYVKSIFLGVLAWAFAQVLGVLLISLVERLGGHMYQAHAALSQTSYLVALLVGGLLPAIAEEMAFRGYLQWSLGPLGSRAAVLITGTLFGAMHLSLIRLLPLALLGIIFSEAVQRAGSILPSMIMHFLNNAILLSLAFFLKPGRALPGLDPMPPDASWPTLLVLLATVVTLSLLIWAIAKSFGPEDVQGETGASKAGVPGDGTAAPAVPQERFTAKLLLPLLPAILLFGWMIVAELHAVFNH